MVSTDVELGARVRTLLDAHGVPRAEAARLLGIDPSGLSRALNGERTFKAREIALISERLNVSTSLLLESRETAPSLALAARQSAHSKDAIRRALERVALFSELAELIDSRPPADLPEVEVSTSGLPWQQGEIVAEDLLSRTDLGQEHLPARLHDLAEFVEHSFAVGVSIEPLSAGLDGLSVWSDRLRLAMVNAETAVARQRWTMAHELGHLVMRDTDDLLVDETVWRNTSMESRANGFAAAFLMPGSLVREAWRDEAAPNESLISQLLEKFHVSLDALAFRLHNLGCVNAAGRDQIRAMRPLASMMRNQAGSAGDVWLPTNLTRDAITAYGEGRLGVRWLAALFRLETDELLERLNTSPEEVAALDAADQPLIS